MLTESQCISFADIFFRSCLPRGFIICTRNDKLDIGIARVVAVEQIAVEFNVGVFARLNGRVALVVGKVCVRSKWGDQVAFGEGLERNEMAIVGAVVEDDREEGWMSGFVEGGGQGSIACC